MGRCRFDFQVEQASQAAEKVDSGKILVAQAHCLCAFLNIKRIHRVIDRKNRTGRVPALLALAMRGKSKKTGSTQKWKANADQRRSSVFAGALPVGRDASNACSIDSSERPLVSIPMKM
jgi:hypothetical protein